MSGPKTHEVTASCMISLVGKFWDRGERKLLLVAKG